MDPKANIHDTARRILAGKGIDPQSRHLPEQSVADYLVEQTEEAMRLMIPKRFLRATCEHPEVREWVDLFQADPATCPSLLLMGPTGTGKTCGIVSGIRTVVVDAARARRPLSWRFIDHPTFNAEMRPDGFRHLQVFDSCVAADLLALDDLGAGMKTDWTGDTLYRVVNTRWAEQRPTIGSTNLSPAKFKSELGDPIASRFADGIVIALKGDDRRRARRRSAAATALMGEDQ